MDHSVWMGTAISLTGLVLAFLSLNHRLRKDKREHQEQFARNLKESITTLCEKLEGDLAKVEARIEKLDEKRSDDVSKLHSRVSELENRTFANLLERISRLEGEIRGLANIIDVIHERLMASGKDDI